MDKFWLEVTNEEGQKELVNMNNVDNICGDESGCTLWFFGCDADNNIKVKEPYSAFKAATQAIGR